MATTAGISATLSLNASAFTAGLQAGTQATQRFAQQTSAAMRMSQTQLQNVANSAGSVAGQMRRAGTAAQGAGQGATNSGMGMLMLSQAIDDVQYGFKGIVNNIAPLVMALGGSSGLAGALTIAAVGVNQLITMWDRLNSLQENARLQARNTATYLKQTADAIKAASDAGTASGEFAVSALDRQQAGRDAQDRATARRLTGTGATAEESLAERVRLAEERLAKDKEQQAELAARLAVSSKELSELQEKDLRARRQFEADRNSASANITYKEQIRTKDAIGRFFTNATAFFGYDPFAAEKDRINKSEYGGLAPRDQTRMAFLQEQVKGLAEARAATETRSGAGFQDLEDLKLDLARTTIRESFAKIKDFASQAFEVLAAIGRRAEAEAAAAKREAEARAAQIQRFDEWGAAMRQAAEATRQELAARQAAHRKANEDIQIQHLRSRGRGAAADRLEAKVTRERRVEELMKDDPLRTRADAEAIARQEERDRRGGSGQRLPRAGEGKRPSPLDEDRRARGFRPETPALDDAARRPRLKRPAAEGAAPNGKGDADIIAGLKELGTGVVNKLQELINATRTPVADGIKPVNG